jgi:hypothetical protein
MSSNQKMHRQSTPPTDPTVARDVAAFFARLGSAELHPQLRAVTGSSQFNIEGAGRWRVAITDGVVTVAEVITAGATGAKTAPADAPADAVVTVSAADMARILRGEGHLNAFSAVLQEIMTVRGDPAFTTSLLDVFSFGHGGTDTPTDTPSTDTP